MNIYRSMSCEVCKYSWLKLQGISKYHFWPPNWWCSFWSTAKYSTTSVKPLFSNSFLLRTVHVFKINSKVKLNSYQLIKHNQTRCYSIIIPRDPLNWPASWPAAAMIDLVWCCGGRSCGPIMNNLSGLSDQPTTPKIVTNPLTSVVKHESDSNCRNHRKWFQDKHPPGWRGGSLSGHTTAAGWPMASFGQLCNGDASGAVGFIHWKGFQ